MALAPAEARYANLRAASKATGLSRDYLRTLIKRRQVRGTFVKSYGRWQVDMESLLGHLRSTGFQVNEALTTITVVVVGTTLPWVADFAEHLPAGLRAVYAGSPFDCGRCVEQDRPRMAVLDFRIGRGIAVDLGRRLVKMSIPCVGLTLEDEGDVSGLQRAGFAAVVRNPIKIATVRDAITSIMS